MGTQGASQHSYTLDAEKILHDAAVVTATGNGQVSAADKVVDFGNTDSNGVENLAFGKYDLVIDVRALDFTTGDENVLVVFQLADDDSDFSAATTVIDKVIVPFGATATIGATNGIDQSGTGRTVVGVDNEHQGTVYRYARVTFVAAGTTPSITPLIWIAEKK